MGSKLSTARRVKTSVNAFTNCDALFDAAAELFGINRETIGGIIQLKGEIFANTELAASLEVQLKSTMHTLCAMGVLKSILP